MENDKIISLTNLFQHLLFAEILSEWEIEFMLPYLVSVKYWFNITKYW